PDALSEDPDDEGVSRAGPHRQRTARGVRRHDRGGPHRAPRVGRDRVLALASRALDQAQASAGGSRAHAAVRAAQRYQDVVAYVPRNHTPLGPGPRGRAPVLRALSSAATRRARVSLTRGLTRAARFYMLRIRGIPDQHSSGISASWSRRFLTDRRHSP